MIETASLTALLRPIARDAGLDLLRALANARADVATQARYQELAEKKSDDRLTPEELAELESLVRANSVLSVLKSEAQLRLKSSQQ